MRINTLMWLPLIILMGACGGLDTYVRADDATLGRVVVYRNGIAYFERRARTTGDKLDLTVPDNKINDFLKSLNVVDAADGSNLPVSFPTRRVTGKGDVVMTIQLPDSRPRDVILTYISDAPAWKPTYRVMVDAKGKVSLAGWAIVDNTSGEDWNNVRVGVGASSALSFRYDLRTVHRVHRQTLRVAQIFSPPPPRGGGVHRGPPAGARRVVMQFDDKDIWRPSGHPDRADVETSAVVADGRSRFNFSKASSVAPSPAAKAALVARQKRRSAYRQQQKRAKGRVRALATRLKNEDSDIVIHGQASASEGDSRERALDRANVLRNRLIHEGIAPARLRVAVADAAPGQRAGVKVVAQPSRKPQSANTNGGKGVASEAPIGESHFESRLPMTVKRGTSAMVSVIQKGTKGHIVYLFDPDSARGDSRFAFKAVRFVNPTGSTLEAGPVTVYGQNRFIGEGLTDPIAPKSSALVPFAMDRQVRVDRHRKYDDRIDKLVRLRRGVLTAKVRHTRRTMLSIVNRSTERASLYVRHKVAKGWHLDNSPEVVEHVGDSYLFRVALKAGASREVVLAESTPMRRTVQLRTPVGIELVSTYLASKGDTSSLAGQLRGLLATHKQIEHLQAGIGHLRERGEEYRLRMDELHAQIISLEGMKTANRLMRHLQGKMKQMSEAVQKVTMGIVDRQEQLMLKRIRFQDGVSELSLDRRVSALPATKRAAL